MWPFQYRPGYYISGNFDSTSCTVIYSPTGYGNEWTKECKSVHAAKLAITKHVKENENVQHQQ